MLNNIVDNIEQCWQQNIFQCCFQQTWTGCAILAVYTVSLISLRMRKTQLYHIIFVGSRACAANHYVIAEKCPYGFRMVCNVQFGDRRLHRIVVDHSFVISFGKCRNAYGLLKMDIYCLQGASFCIQEDLGTFWQILSLLNWR